MTNLADLLDLGLNAAQARALLAFRGDALLIRAADAPLHRRRLPHHTNEPGYVHCSSDVRRRYDRIRAHLGRPLWLVLLAVMVDGWSMAEAAVELGHEGPNAVRILLGTAADELVREYAMAEAA
jgi:hypothetical protein